MIGRASRAVLFIFGFTLAACETTGPTALEKSALDSELKNETLSGSTWPSGCPTVTMNLPAGKSDITVSYQEPATTQNGTPLADLAYTTIYVSTAKTAPRAIRVWTNNPHGGAPVTVKDIPVSSQEVGICVTATNWARQESGPAASPTVTQTGK
jgi:hypothetical protein